MEKRERSVAEREDMVAMISSEGGRERPAPEESDDMALEGDWGEGGKGGGHVALLAGRRTRGRG